MSTNFGKTVKKLRMQKNITQSQLAEILSVGRSTIAGYETKGKQPDYDKLEKLADYFNVTIDYLLGYSNDIYLNNSALENNAQYKEEIISIDDELITLINKLENENYKFMCNKIELSKPTIIALKKSLYNILEMISAMNKLSK